MAEACPPRIDAHQHFWQLGEVAYPWLKRTEHGPIYRDFVPEDLEPHLRATGNEHTICVQAANSFSDTDAMLARADHHPWIAAVTGWVPLLDPAAAARALDRYGTHPAFRGVRHLVHDEPDPDWLRRPEVARSLALLAEREMPFEIPAVFPRHLAHVPELAAKLPGLSIVIDHLGKPPPAGAERKRWAAQLCAAAAHANVFAKVSGLCPTHGCRAEELRPCVEVAIECFGPQRLMVGSDWPVSLLAGDYETVWHALVASIDQVPQSGRDAMLGGTAARLYRLDGSRQPSAEHG